MEDPLQLEKLNGVVLVIVLVQLLILEIEGKALVLHNKNMNGNKYLRIIAECMKKFTFSNFDFLDLMNMMRS